MKPERLNVICDLHDHDPGLPDRLLRQHVLAHAIRETEAMLLSHGYPNPARGFEVLHVAIEDAIELENLDDLPLEN